MAPFSSSSSESALGLFSDLLVSAWFSMGPFPSPGTSPRLPVINSTAASTAKHAEDRCENSKAQD